MKGRFNKLWIIVGFLVCCSWMNFSDKQIKKSKWLLGSWESKTQKGSIYETWIKISEDEFFGKSYSVKGKDTVVLETVKLVQVQDSLFYIPTVKNQNKGLPVHFSLKFISENKMVFENQKHDFPQVISYSLMNSDSMIAEISGIRNGQKLKQIFPMKRLK